MWKSLLKDPKVLPKKIIQRIRRQKNPLDRRGLNSLGELYHEYSFFGVVSRQKDGMFLKNQRAKEPIIRAYIDFAIAKCSASPSISFIELFCADGYFAMLARKLGATRSIGIDNDRDGFFVVAKKIARRLKLDSVEFLKVDVNEMELLGEFDIIANVGGLYHVPNPEVILDKSYQQATRYLIVQSVVSLANNKPDYFEAPAPGLSWGCRYSRASFDKMIRSRGWNIIDSHFNELLGNDRLEDLGSVYYLIGK